MVGVFFRQSKIQNRKSKVVGNLRYRYRCRIRPLWGCGHGAAAEESPTQTTLLIRLRFSASPWTTRTGLRKPGPKPVGSGRFAQYTWPWATTIRRLQVCVLPLLKWLDPGTCLPLRRLDSSPRLRLQDRDARCIRLRPPCTPGFVTSSADGTTARLQRKPYRESKSQFSYPKYNQGELHLQIVAVRADTVVRDVWGGAWGAAADKGS
jgi:hypothetical protein